MAGAPSCVCCGDIRVVLTNDGESWCEDCDDAGCDDETCRATGAMVLERIGRNRDVED